MQTKPPIREDMLPAPDFIKRLHRTADGVPIPWFVPYVEGKPEFRAMDTQNFVVCLNHDLCWICGFPLRKRRVFVTTPTCGINRITGEPPCHVKCALWAVKHCPFLANPNHEYSQCPHFKEIIYFSNKNGINQLRNPGVVMVWYCKDSSIVHMPHDKKPIIKMGVPFQIKFFREGREATRKEIRTSLDIGLKELWKLAEERLQTSDLHKAIERLLMYAPAD